MYTKNNIIYSDAGKYLKYNNQISFNISLPVEEQDNITEIELNLDNIEIKPFNVIIVDNIFMINVNKLTKKDIKLAIINTRYDNNDQIALVLNRNNSEESEQSYFKMQEYRAFAEALTNKILEKLQ